MDRPAGVGRTVVQDVLRRALARLPDAVINPHLLPAFQGFGLILGQVGLHGEGGFRQIDRHLQIEWHSVTSPK